MRAEFDGAQTFDDILAITLKYGSKEQITKINTQKAQIDVLPQEFKNSLVAQLRKAVPMSSDITSIQTTIKGSNATLVVLSTKGLNGIVKMVLEGKEWRFESEVWKSNK